ncbi:MAG: hypothetical protein MK052_06440 [Alphaproteobacteria bacterium]|nr:hypothetical protein [Alphaproteobacteria bacterium]
MKSKKRANSPQSLLNAINGRDKDGNSFGAHRELSVDHRNLSEIIVDWMDGNIDEFLQDSLLSDQVDKDDFIDIMRHKKNPSIELANYIIAIKCPDKGEFIKARPLISKMLDEDLPQVSLRDPEALYHKKLQQFLDEDIVVDECDFSPKQSQTDLYNVIAGRLNQIAPNVDIDASLGALAHMLELDEEQLLGKAAMPKKADKEYYAAQLSTALFPEDDEAYHHCHDLVLEAWNDAKPEQKPALAQMIKFVRLSSGYTRDEVAESKNLRWYGYIESGDNVPSKNSLHTFAQILPLSAPYLEAALPNAKKYIMRLESENSHRFRDIVSHWPEGREENFLKNTSLEGHITYKDFEALMDGEKLPSDDLMKYLKSITPDIGKKSGFYKSLLNADKRFNEYRKFGAETVDINDKEGLISKRIDHIIENTRCNPGEAAVVFAQRRNLNATITPYRKTKYIHEGVTEVITKHAKALGVDPMQLGGLEPLEDTIFPPSLAMQLAEKVHPDYDPHHSEVVTSALEVWANAGKPDMVALPKILTLLKGSAVGAENLPVELDQIFPRKNKFMADEDILDQYRSLAGNSEEKLEGAIDEAKEFFAAKRTETIRLKKRALNTPEHHSIEHDAALKNRYANVMEELDPQIQKAIDCKTARINTHEEGLRKFDELAKGVDAVGMKPEQLVGILKNAQIWTFSSKTLVDKINAFITLYDQGVLGLENKTGSNDTYEPLFNFLKHNNSVLKQPAHIIRESGVLAALVTESDKNYFVDNSYFGDNNRYFTDSAAFKKAINLYREDILSGEKPISVDDVANQQDPASQSLWAKRMVFEALASEGIYDIREKADSFSLKKHFSKVFDKNPDIFFASTGLKNKISSREFLSISNGRKKPSMGMLDYLAEVMPNEFGDEKYYALLKEEIENSELPQVQVKAPHSWQDVRERQLRPDNPYKSFPPSAIIPKKRPVTTVEEDPAKALADMLTEASINITNVAEDDLPPSAKHTNREAHRATDRNNGPRR